MGGFPAISLQPAREAGRASDHRSGDGGGVHGGPTWRGGDGAV